MFVADAKVTNVFIGMNVGKTLPSDNEKFTFSVFIYDSIMNRTCCIWRGTNDLRNLKIRVNRAIYEIFVRRFGYL